MSQFDGITENKSNERKIIKEFLRKMDQDFLIAREQECNAIDDNSVWCQEVRIESEKANG